MYNYVMPPGILFDDTYLRRKTPVKLISAKSCQSVFAILAPNWSSKAGSPGSFRSHQLRRPRPLAIANPPTSSLAFATPRTTPSCRKFCDNCSTLAAAVLTFHRTYRFSRRSKALRLARLPARVEPLVLCPDSLPAVCEVSYILLFQACSPVGSRA